MQLFPINLETRPLGFAPLAKEPPFIAARHLALEAPAAVLRLTDLGCSADEIVDCSSDFGVSYADWLSMVARRLEDAAQSIRNVVSVTMEYFGD